ncbi:MAG: 5'/3'-nucleotidase SurE [Bacteroidia bacterium]
MPEKPLILIANDDGIHAPGLAALVRSVSELGNVFVVAPDKGQSGMGHAITINSTLRVEQLHLFGSSITAFSCSGTPVDCVKMAINKLLPRRPDLCISGINHGANHSINVIYSGTMSAAMEGAIEGVPSIGFSLLDYQQEADFRVAEKIATTLCTDILQNGLPKGVCLNVNIPKGEPETIKGIKVCRQSRGTWIEELDERTDPAGRKYYWLTGRFQDFEPEATDTDVFALENRYASVVPVQFDLTAHVHLKSLHYLEQKG